MPRDLRRRNGNSASSIKKQHSRRASPPMRNTDRAHRAFFSQRQPSCRYVTRDKCKNTERVPQGNALPCRFTGAFPIESVSRPTLFYRGRFAATG